MLALQSTVTKLQAQLLASRLELAVHIREWNALVERINAKGGEDFLSGKTQAKQLSEEDIKRLLMLCHPDKHDGKPMAVEMTKKLLALRG